MNYGNVYIIKKDISCSYKIGVSSDVIGRLKTLQIGCPDLLEIYKTFDCKLPFELEKKTHKEFKEFRLNGEWFSFENIEPIEYYMELTCRKINESMMTCNLCNYETRYTQHYEKHLESYKHKINYERENPGIIQPKFRSPDEYKFECPRCNKIFKWKHHVVRHLNKKKKCGKVKGPKRTHDLPIEGPKKTHDILSQTQIFDDLNIVNMINENENKTCNYCRKIFSNNSHMNRHLKICKNKKEKEEIRIILEKHNAEINKIMEMLQLKGGVS